MTDPAALARSGRLDEAVAAVMRAAEARGDRSLADFYAPGNGRTVIAIHAVARALVDAGRLEEAEAVLRTGHTSMRLLMPLVQLLLSRHRVSDAESMLRGHLRADQPEVRFALSVVLTHAGRSAEAAALRPADGWPHERRDEPPPADYFDNARFYTAYLTAGTSYGSTDDGRSPAGADSLYPGSSPSFDTGW